MVSGNTTGIITGADYSVIKLPLFLNTYHIAPGNTSGIGIIRIVGTGNTTGIIAVADCADVSSGNTSGIGLDRGIGREGGYTAGIVADTDYADVSSGNTSGIRMRSGRGNGNTAGIITVTDCSTLVISCNSSRIGIGRGRSSGRGNITGVITVADCPTATSRDPSCIGIGRGNTSVQHSQILNRTTYISKQASIDYFALSLDVHK